MAPVDRIADTGSGENLVQYFIEWFLLHMDIDLRGIEIHCVII
jgi:hypothetical protein